MSNLFFTFLALLLIFERAWAPPSLISKMISKKSPDSDSSASNKSKSSEHSKKSDGSVMAMKRLQKELKKLMENEGKNNDSFTIDVDEKNFYRWNVKIKKALIDDETVLFSSMRDLNVEYLLFEFTFNAEFPLAPPFVRVVSPTIDGCYVFSGGALCMELLTPERWAPTYTVEGIIRQIAATMPKTTPCRVTSKTASSSYSMENAKQGFADVVRIHKNDNWSKLPRHDRRR